MGIPGRNRQEAIQLKSPISFKLGTIVGFGDHKILTKYATYADIHFN